MAAPTFVGVFTVPLDTGTQTEPASVILGPPDLVTGDLIYIVAYNESGTIADGLGIDSVSSAGQTWITDNTASSYSYQGTAAGHKIEWCTWNGVSTNALTINFPAKAGTRGAGVQGLVFRPDSSTKVWNIDTAPVWAALSGGVSTTITGITPVNADTVTIARVLSDDDNQWSVTSTGWSQTGLTAQYRNAGGSDLSASFAYQLKGASSATGNATFVQTSLGPDAGTSVIISFYAAAPPEFFPRTLFRATQLDGCGSDGIFIGNSLE